MMKRHATLLTVLVVLLLGAAQAQGATYYWDGGGDGTTWTDPDNWSLNSGYPGSGTGDTAGWSGNVAYATPGPQDITLDADLSMANCYILQSGVADRTITIGGAGSLEIT